MYVEDRYLMMTLFHTKCAFCGRKLVTFVPQHDKCEVHDKFSRLFPLCDDCEFPGSISVFFLEEDIEKFYAPHQQTLPGL